uniref:Putative transposase (Putative), gypsy type n=1 Tax=Tanacetum cinerariifolium TaxID=118510 RepID=A0A6L2MPQ5_TANCI|nr:putative transposase (putative), gypsy type [Tanacetum cinerariifolium]
MGRDTIKLENAVSTISQEYLLEFTSWYGIPESLHHELSGPADPIVKFPEGKVCVNTKFFKISNFRIPISQFLFDILGHYQIYLSIVSDKRGQNMDFFSLISAPNPTKVKTETRPRAAHEVPLLTATANCVTDMEDMTGASGFLGTPSNVEKSPLDFPNEDLPPLITGRIRTGEQGQDELSLRISPTGNPPYTEVAPEPDLEKEMVAMGALVNKRRCKRGPDEAEANAPPKVMRKDHVASHLSQKTLVHAEGVNDPDPMSYAKPPPASEQDIAQSSRKAVVTEDPDSKKSASFTSMVGSPGGIYQPGWGVTNNCRLDTLAACQDMVYHIVPPGYFSELRHLPNNEFLNQYNTTLARQVAMGSQLSLRFKQETKLLKKAVAQVARRGQRIPAKEKHIKNLEALLEAEVDMKDIAKAKNVELVKELESLRVQFYDLQVSNHQLSQKVSTLQAQVTGEKRIKAAFKEFKKYEDDHVFAEVVSAGISKGMSKGLKHGVEHEKAKVVLTVIEAYDPEADTKCVAALLALKDLKYPLVDQLEKLKDAPIDVIVSSLYMESDSREDASQLICKLRPSSFQLKIPVYPKVRNPKDPWSFKEEILLEDAITANISHAEKKKKCRVVCRTHGVSSAHHARSDGIPVSVPTVAPQGLAILLVDAATQTYITEDEASPKLLRSKSLPPMYNLDWP